MLQFIVRVLLTALLFCFIFPAIAPGVQFHGAFWPDGVIYAGVFSVVAYLVGLAIRLAAAAFSIATLGAGLLIVVPAFIFGFWLIPALQLQVFAHYFPDVFSVSGWLQAIWAGLLLMVVNMMTGSYGGDSSSDSRSDS